VTLRLRADRLHWLETDGEIVALDEAALVYLNANPSAGVLWRLLAEGTTREALVAGLLDEFDVDEPTAGRDVDAFVEELSERGLLER
jgi:Coenzyme PQQ synthesis protein D (PqqD)